ncbi:MFS transporter [Thiocapsa roseopersicina]|uniref:Predicted arabinose efflux permease, MFS family n=1 Tax=Thiocapsa roseopersicina TaxID=1058 RepID=A0A1H2XXC5_THIRO|nr:MFS transporter [Thiocapsa roseopersicina]SDW97395.1 Predicted arabinose efflux permease, MFS family [Thiocapsa roseopersicina]
MPDLDRTYRIGPIHLAPSILPRNGWTFLAAAFFSIGLMIFISIGQTYILNEHLGVPESKQGAISGNLVFLTEIVTLLLFLPAGVLMDRIGRRGVYAAGFLVLALTYVLYPLAESVEALYVYRILYAIGVVAVAGGLSTVLADYPAERSRGKLVAIVGVMSGLGVVLISQGLGAMPKVFTGAGFDGVTAGRLTHFIVAGLAVAVALLLLWGLKPGLPVRLQDRPSVRELLVGGFAHGRNPRILLAYSSAFIARGDQSVNAIFLVLWGTLAAKAAGMESASAVMSGTLIFVMAQISALVWAPVLGPLLDRIDRVTGLAICMALAALGNLSLLALEDPLSSYGPVFFILLGIGQISVYLGGQSLIGQEAPAGQRGSVLGAFNVAGAIGILLITPIGGYLFDRVDPRAPFYVVGAINVLLVFASIYVRLRHSPESASVSASERV